MTYDETIALLRDWIGRDVAVTVTHGRYGSADGYLADFSGRLVRVDEPICGVDAPVFYFRWADGSGFGIHEEIFRSAGWETVAGHISLNIDLDGVLLSVAASE